MSFLYFKVYSNFFVYKHIDIEYKKINQNDQISLTDISRYVNSNGPKIPIQTWMRNKDVVA